MKKSFILFIIAILLILLASCEKEKTGGEGKIPMENIPYGTHTHQKMDVKLPQGLNENQKIPIVLCIHGGSWSAGDKTNFDYIQQVVNNNNCAYVSINYRLVQDGATYVEMLDDINSAITYLKNNSNKYHLRTDKMCVIGNSAGGHLAMLYTYTVESPIKIAFVSSEVGPTDFLDPGQIELNGVSKLDLLNKLLNTQVTPSQLQNTAFIFPQSWYLASPIYHVNDNTIPTVLAYGMLDNLVSYTNAIRLNNKLEEFGVAHRLITFPNSGHGLDNDPSRSDEYLQTMLYFLNTYLL